MLLTKTENVAEDFLAVFALILNVMNRNDCLDARIAFS